MARFDAHHPRTGSAAPRGGLRGLAAGALGASVLLVVPFVIWARIGDGGLASVAAVSVVALAACFALLRWTTRRYLRRRLPARLPVAPVQTQWSPSTYRGHGRPRATTTSTRRSGASAHESAHRRCRPAYVSRFPRDVGCRASSRNLQARTAR